MTEEIQWMKSICNDCRQMIWISKTYEGIHRCTACSYHQIMNNKETEMNIVTIIRNEINELMKKANYQYHGYLENKSFSLSEYWRGKIRGYMDILKVLKETET